MKAIQYRRYGGPEVLEYADLPDPEFGPHEVLVAVRAASVVPGDWKVRAGLLQEMFPLTLPTVPGRDGAGVVVAVGSAVDYARPGDAVCFVAGHGEQGSYAERIVRGADTVVPKPAGLSFAEGAALMHAGICAWIALVETARIEAGMKVLVHGGSGAIGGMAVQMARHFGAEVVATCRAANAGYVRALGAATVIAYDEQDFTRLVDGCDVVLDLVGGDVHARSHGVLRQGGTLVYLLAAPIEEPSRDHGVRVVQARIHDSPAVLRQVVGLARAGALRPQLCRVLPLARAREAHRMLEAGAHGRGRVVLEMDE